MMEYDPDLMPKVTAVAVTALLALFVALFAWGFFRPSWRWYRLRSRCREWLRKEKGKRRRWMFRPPTSSASDA